MLTILTLLAMLNVIKKCNANREKIKRTYPGRIPVILEKVFFSLLKYSTILLRHQSLAYMIWIRKSI